MTNSNRFAAEPADEDLGDLVWGDDVAEIPDWIYTDPRVYAREQARIFRGPTWKLCRASRPSCRIRATMCARMSATSP
ncbi:MAG: hypothetical protein WDO24_24960 [Pseudomonadota bacterium]